MGTGGFRSDALFEVTFIGADDAARALELAAKRWPAAFNAAIYEEASAIFAESQRRVPVDTGRLRASGGVSPPEEGGLNAVVSIYYGTDYALAVHERHGTKSGYLLDPFMERFTGMADRVAKRTEEIEASGVGLGSLPKIRGAKMSGRGRSGRRR